MKSTSSPQPQTIGIPYSKRERDREKRTMAKGACESSAESKSQVPDSSEQHAFPEELNSLPDQDEEVFDSTAKENIPADDDGFLRALYQFWLNISGPPIQTQNLRVPRIGRGSSTPRPGFRTSRRTKESKDSKESSGVFKRVVPDVDEIAEWDLVSWVKDHVWYTYAWLKSTVNLYKWAKWVLCNWRAVVRTVVFSAVLLRILVDIVADIQMRRRWVKFGHYMRQRQRWERIGQYNQFVVGQGGVLGGKGIGLLASVE